MREFGAGRPARAMPGSAWARGLRAGLAVGAFVLASSAVADCTPVARLVSLQGTIEVRRAPSEEWTPAKSDALLCPGDSLRVFLSSQAAAATLPWPCAASPAASALANPAVHATQLVVEAAPPLVCANAGTAITDAIIITNISITNFRIVLLLLLIAASGWLTPCSLSRRPHAEGSCHYSVPNNFPGTE